MIEALAAGIVVGLSGLIPFVHPNFILTFFQNTFNPIAAGIFATALVFSRLAFEPIASAFLLYPSQSQSASVLPAHSMLLEGNGLLAFGLMLRSAFLAIAVSVLISPLVAVSLPLVFSIAKPITGYVLLALVAIALFSEKNFQRAGKGLFVFALAGAFGFLILSLPLLKQPLLPLLAGLFGMPALLQSFSSAKEIPEQKKTTEIVVDGRLVFLGVLLGAFSSVLPAVSPAVLAALLFVFMESTPLRFLVAASATAASKTFFDFIAVFAIGKARSGAAAFVSQNAFLSWQTLALFLAAGIVAFAIACLASLAIAKFAARELPKTGRLAAPFLLILAVAAIFAFEGFAGLFVLAIATCIGLLPLLLGVKRSYSMGSLLLPSMLYFFGFSQPILSTLF